MAGENCLLIATNYGMYAARAETLNYGMEIITDEDASRTSATLYPKQVTTGEFSVGLVFRRWAEYQSFGDWMRAYERKLAIGTALFMRVVVPSHGFDRVGVPTGNITFGDAVTDVVWRMTLTFDGSPDPQTVQNAAVSTFQLPKNDVKDAPYFYPGAVQLSGNESAPDLLYKADPKTDPLPTTSAWTAPFKF